MLKPLVQTASETLDLVRRRWGVVLLLALAGLWVWFAVWMSDVQGRMDLPRAYAVRMTCEEDPEASLWHGGCDRIQADIDKTQRPGFFELYRAFVTVHHASSPREAGIATTGAQQAEADFDLAKLLAGQRYGLAIEAPEFDGIANRAQADAVMAAMDERDRALLAIGRAGLGMDALFAGALANLMHPGAMIEGAERSAAIHLGTAKQSDFATGIDARR